MNRWLMSLAAALRAVEVRPTVAAEDTYPEFQDDVRLAELAGVSPYSAAECEEIMQRDHGSHCANPAEHAR